MIFPITAAVVVACLTWVRTRDGRRSALGLALGVWLFAVVLTALPVLKYNVNYSVLVDGYVALCILATTAAFMWLRSPASVPPPRPEDPAKERSVYVVLSLLGALGAALLLVDAQALGTQLSPSFLLENLTTIRQNALEAGRVSHTAIYLPGFMLMSGTYVGLLAAAKLGRAGGPLLMSLGVLNAILIAAVSLFAFGGRTILVNALVLLLAGAYLAGRRINLNPRTVTIGVLLLVGGFYFSTTYFAAREGVIGVDRYLSQLERAEMRPWIAPAGRDSQAVGNALVNYGYFASPLPTLAWYVQEGALPGPFWGAYSNPLPLRAVNAVAPGTDDWLDVRDKVFLPLEAAGYPGNVWGTWIRDLLVDFGYVGAVAFCALFGAFMAWTRNRFERTGAVHYHLLEVLACVTLGFGAFQNLMWVNIYSGSFLLTLGAMFAVRTRLADARAPRAAALEATR